VSKFVKVVTKILWPLFSGHGVFSAIFQRYLMIAWFSGSSLVFINQVASYVESEA